MDVRKALATVALAATVVIGASACGGTSGYDTSYQQDYPTYVYVHGQRTVVHHYHTVVIHHTGTRPGSVSKRTTVTTRTARTGGVSLTKSGSSRSGRR